MLFKNEEFHLWRRRNKIKLKDVAEYCHCAVSLLSQWERGEVLHLGYARKIYLECFQEEFESKKTGKELKPYAGILLNHLKKIDEEENNGAKLYDDIVKSYAAEATKKAEAEKQKPYDDLIAKYANKKEEQKNG